MIDVYCGNGKGKTTAAFGQAIREASAGKSVIILQFLKKKNQEQSSFMSRLEPEIKLFRFEKADREFADLSEEEKQEAIVSIQNGMHFAKKVLTTGECQLFIMDEVLGILEQGIISADEVRALLREKDSETDVILTGVKRCPAIEDMVDHIYSIEVMKANK